MAEELEMVCANLIEVGDDEFFQQEEKHICKDDNPYLSDGEPNGIDSFEYVYFAFNEG